MISQEHFPLAGHLTNQTKTILIIASVLTAGMAGYWIYKKYYVPTEIIAVNQ